MNDPYAKRVAYWVANMTHAEREIPTPLTDAGRKIIRHALRQVKAADGDPATWTRCEYCDGTGDYENVAKGTSGICYRCHGKGAQSPADVKRNRGYQAIQRQAEACQGVA